MSNGRDFAVKHATAETFLGVYSIGESLSFVVPAWSYGFTKDEADRLAAQHGGTVVTRPTWDAKAKRYSWAAPSAGAKVIQFPAR